MASPKTQFICQNCGGAHARWSGRCDACGAWNTLVEESPNTGVATGPGKPMGKGRVVPLEALDGDTTDAPRIKTGISEFDRVTGGGLVEGSALLVGGDPGIGKSTLLLQVALQLKKKVLYVSGEESQQQIKRRADRINSNSETCFILNETNVEKIIHYNKSKSAADKLKKKLTISVFFFIFLDINFLNK